MIRIAYRKMIDTQSSSLSLVPAKANGVEFMKRYVFLVSPAIHYSIDIESPAQDAFILPRDFATVWETLTFHTMLGLRVG